MTPASLPSAGVVAVFVAGAGRTAPAAWPLQRAGVAAERAVFLDASQPKGARPRPNQTEFAAQARQLVDALGFAGRGGHVVAHSHGAVAALQAAARHPDLVRTLALFEPACFGLARGHPAVEEHIRTMEPVLALAADPRVSDEEYARRFYTALGASPQPTPGQPATFRRLRAVPAPWTADLDPAVPARTPTLVITGGWSPLYEQVAAALTELGAQHATLPGHRHRPQDNPASNDLLHRFWETAFPN